MMIQDLPTDLLEAIQDILEISLDEDALSQEVTQDYDDKPIELSGDVEEILIDPPYVTVSDIRKSYS